MCVTSTAYPKSNHSVSAAAFSAIWKHRLKRLLIPPGRRQLPFAENAKCFLPPVRCCWLYLTKAMAMHLNLISLNLSTKHAKDAIAWLIKRRKPAGVVFLLTHCSCKVNGLILCANKQSKTKCGG